MTDDELREAVRWLRERAEVVGPLHAYWDLIFDAEEILAGRTSIMSRDDLEEMIEQERKG